MLSLPLIKEMAMFSTLLESRSQRTRRTGGSLLSIALHAAAIGAMVAATANATVRTRDDPGETRITFAPPPKPTPQQRTPSAAVERVFSNTAPALGTPTLDVPLDIPTGIPPVDLSKGVTDASVFDTGKRGVPTGVPGGATTLPSTGYFFAGQVEKPAMSLPGTLGPAFPDMLRSAGIEGQVLAEFVVDTTGMARMDTFRVLKSDHDLFTAAVRRALERTRFLPAEVGERKVPQLVQQMFQFLLNR